MAQEAAGAVGGGRRFGVRSPARPPSTRTQPFTSDESGEGCAAGAPVQIDHSRTSETRSGFGMTTKTMLADRSSCPTATRYLHPNVREHVRVRLGFRTVKDVQNRSSAELERRVAVAQFLRRSEARHNLFCLHARPILHACHQAWARRPVDGIAPAGAGDHLGTEHRSACPLEPPELRKRAEA